MRIGSLFSGAGGLDMAVQAVFGGDIVWHSEVDKAASKVLAYRFPDVPNLGDITQVDWADVPAVDVLCGGFPCQDVSAAGKRAGIKDGTRSGLWAIFTEAIDALRPQWVVIENVRGLLSATAHRTVEDDEQSSDMESGAAVMGNGTSRPVLRAAGAVLGDLADLGYDAQWATVAAASVGAPHQRERVFILASLADADSKRCSLEDNPCGRESDVAGCGGWCEPKGHGTACCGGAVSAVGGAEPGVALLPTPRVGGGGDCESERRGNSPGLESIAVTDLMPTPTASDCTGGGQDPARRVGHTSQLIDEVLNTQWGKYARAIARWEQIVGPAPAPTEPNKNGNPRLSAAFSEWLMGWSKGWVTDPAIGISRNDQLRIVGNGVCPQQAAAALRYLLSLAAGNPASVAAVEPQKLLPTPCARDYKDGEFPASHARNTPSLGAISSYFGEDA